MNKEKEFEINEGCRKTSGSLLGIVFTAAGRPADLSRYAQDLRAADELLSQGDFNGVIKKLRPWTERLPDRPEAQHFLGLAHYRLRNFDTAIRYLSAALEREKQESAAWKQTVEILGAAYYFESRWQEAEPLLEKAAAWRPEDSELLYSLAMTYLHLGRGDKARIAFSKIFQVDPAPRRPSRSRPSDAAGKPLQRCRGVDP